MDVRQQCPRCNADMQVRFRRNERTNEWEWVWTCPDCRHEVPIPESVVERFDCE